jgi:hypothetical protein
VTFKLSQLKTFLEANLADLPLPEGEESLPWEDIEWGYYNCTSRSFGTHHLPATIAMGPFLDLMNHQPNYDKNKYFLHPFNLHRKIINRSVI